MPSAQVSEAEDFVRQVSRYHDDPLGYVRDMFPWGEPGDLQNADGPDAWQTAALQEIAREVKAREFDGITPAAPLRFCRASGHDIGKTTMAAWIVNWIKDTRPDSVGTITANTFSQLETKTWAAIQKWSKLALTRDWWEITSSKIYSREKDRQETWFVACQSSNEENSEAFAGQHARFSTSYYIFDEASAIPDEIWKVAEGGLTDGEPMIFAFGNPTRNTGMFFECNFGSKRHRWNHGSIDSRNSGISNKATIEEWLQDYGEDSDFFRVRVRGLPPNAAEDQLIGRDLIESAQKRSVQALPDDPLIAGVDVPDGGAAWFIIRFRRGVDARNVPTPIRIPGSRIDRQGMIAKCAEILNDRGTNRISKLFIDSAFGAAIAERLHTLGYEQVMEVNFGSNKTPDPHYSNMRAYMWGKMLKDWLSRGGIDKADSKLMVDLMGPGWHLNNRNQLVLESKAEMQKRGIPSPDDGDALALTFAFPVAPELKKVVAPQRRTSEGNYIPFG